MPPALSESRKTGTSPAWKRATIASRSPDGRATVQELVGYAGGARWRSSRRAIATYCVKTSTAPSSASTVPTSSSRRSSFSERPAQLGVGLLEEVGGVVADLLETGEELEHQPAAGLLVGLLDAAHAVADVGLVEDDLLAGEAEEVVGLGLGRQLGSDARVGLAAAQQEGADQVGELASLGRLEARLDRAGPHLAEGVAAAEQARDRPVEDRPQLGEVVLDRGAGQRHACRGWGWCAAHGRSADAAFLTCCASSATTRSHVTAASSSASLRIVP